MAALKTKVSEVFDPEYVRTLQATKSLDTASFWHCRQCDGALVVWNREGVMKCRNFSHRPTQMRKLIVDVDLHSDA